MKIKLLILSLLIVSGSFTDVFSQNWNPTHPSWTDSFQANGFCWCNTTYDHGIGEITFEINGQNIPIRTICEELEKHPDYRAYQNGDAPYNDIQCGNGPPNDHDILDEQGCPGRTDLGSAGCNQIGPTWDIDWLETRFGNTSVDTDIVSIQGQSIAKYVSSEDGRRSMQANRDNIGEWETFMVQASTGEMVSFKGSNGKYVSSENGAKAMNCNRDAVGSWEKFTLVSLGDNVYAIKGNNGKYVSHENGHSKGIFCNRDAIGSWEKFIILGLQNNKAYPIDKSEIIQSDVTIYPTIITADNFNMQISIQEDTNGMVEIVSVVGKKVAEKDLGIIKAGTTSIVLNELGSLIQTSGLYLAKVTLGKDTIVKKIMVE